MNRRAFTIIEVIVTAVLFVVILSILVVSLFTARNANFIYREKMYINEEMSIAMMRMVEELKEGSFIFLRDSSDNGLSDGEVYDHIKFRLPVISSSGDITSWSDWIEYIINNDNLIRRDSSGNEIMVRNLVFDKKAVSSDVGSAFEYIASENKLKISLVGSRVILNQLTVDAGIVSAVNLRN